MRSGPAGLRASGATIRPCAASYACRSVEGTSGKPSGAEPLGFPTQAASAARIPGHACPGRSEMDTAAPHPRRHRYGKCPPPTPNRSARIVELLQAMGRGARYFSTHGDHSQCRFQQDIRIVTSIIFRTSTICPDCCGTAFCQTTTQDFPVSIVQSRPPESRIAVPRWLCHAAPAGASMTMCHFTSAQSAQCFLAL